jgi:hypothetical protein
MISDEGVIINDTKNNAVVFPFKNTFKMACYTKSQLIDDEILIINREVTMNPNVEMSQKSKGCLFCSLKKNGFYKTTAYRP